MKKRYILAAAAAALCPLVSIAMPAKPGIMQFVQPDGTTVAVRLMGDENFHYYTTSDGTTVLTEENGMFVPAATDASGRLVKSATHVSPRQLRPAARPRKLPGLYSTTTFPSTGDQKILVILVDYQDVKFNLENPNDYFTRMLNEENFADYHATGSARDWFINSSGGKFRPEFDVYGPVTLQQVRSYYGANDAWGNDNAPQKMAIESCRQLNPTVDFTEYDRDNDGFIDNVFIVYAGRGEASGGGSECVWPHAWNVTYAEPGMNYTFDGKRLDHYACVNEWEISDLGYGMRPVGIGSFVHEFSHVMGLPDLYVTDYSGGSFTPGAWSVMDYGPYNNDLCTPPQYSAWERASLGYLDIAQLPAEGNLALGTLEEGDARIIPTASENEFFILENRQQSGWDAYVPGHGMLVWHIDYNESVWNSNTVNNDPQHNYVDIIEADNERSDKTRTGDAFPGTSAVTALGDNTLPYIRPWDGSNLGFELTDITERDGRICMRINGGAPDIAAPEVEEASDIAPAAFTVNWKGVEGATGYTVTVYAPVATPVADSETDSYRVLTRVKADAAQTSCRITGLTPATSYLYTVWADDGVYGSVETERKTVTTLDPTFDYFTPQILEPLDVTSTAFTAAWEPLEGATEYLLDVYRRENGDPVTVTATFDGGAENLPEGWSSTSTTSYGMASWSGESAPSLRLSADGDCLTTAEYPEGIRRVSFWCRGNSTGTDERVEVEALRHGVWTPLASRQPETAKGGAEITVDVMDMDLTALRISFVRPTSGAIAIDDVAVECYGPAVYNPLEEYLSLSTGTNTQWRVEGLTPGSIYRYSVVANDGTLSSMRSAQMTVTTAQEVGIDTVGADRAICFTLRGRMLTSAVPVTIYDISGRIVAASVTGAEIHTPGIYIIAADGFRPAKAAVK